MNRNAMVGLVGLSLLLGLAVFGVACNSRLDDEDVSPSLLSVSSVNPSNICVDSDGQLFDIDGDGTLDPPPLFSAVSATFTIQSKLRGTSSSAFNDVLIDEYTVDYSFGGIPSLRRGLTLEVPAGGSASVEVIVVSEDDVGLFPAVGRGTATIRFKGEDLSGKPATAKAKMGIDVANACL